MAFHVCYYMYCTGAWKELVGDHLTRLVMGGIYQACERIHCYAVCAKEEVEGVRQWLAQYGDKFVLEVTAESGSEWLCLSHMSTCVGVDDKVLYLHSKGITKHGQESYPTTQKMVDMIHYFLISKFKECLECLEHCHVLGINLWCSDPLHYLGNCWYARGRHIHSLPTQQPVPAKQWVCNKPDITLGTVYQTPTLGEPSSYLGAFFPIYVRFYHFLLPENETDIYLPMFSGKLPVYDIKIFGETIEDAQLAVVDPVDRSARSQSRLRTFLSSLPSLRLSTPLEDPSVDALQSRTIPIGLHAHHVADTVLFEFPQFTRESPLHLQKLYQTDVGVFLKTTGKPSKVFAVYSTTPYPSLNNIDMHQQWYGDTILPEATNTHAICYVHGDISIAVLEDNKTVNQMDKIVK